VGVTAAGLLFLASVWAGAQNALAGGGAFVTFPALLLYGLDARAANVTSTVALFPGQVVAGWGTRRLATELGPVRLRELAWVSLVGGAAGALLLLATPSSVFARLVPYLVLLATGLFAWGAFGPKPAAGAERLGRGGVLAVQAGIAVYGGYFGGGIGFMMLAAMTLAGIGMRPASAARIILAAVMNGAAVLVFALSPALRWDLAALSAAGAVLGGVLGAWAVARVPERALKAVVVAIGLALSVLLFVRQG
jgi:uncharacterized protein